MGEIKEMKTLTLNGTKYESFPDQTARAAAAAKLPAPTSAKVGQFLKVTEVDGTGKIIAVEAADAPAGSGSGQNCSCPLTVETITIGEPGEPGNISVTGIILDYSNIALTEGEGMMLAASVLPSNATNNTVLWKSSNTSIATVNNGYVTAVAEGDAIITAYSVENNSIQATCVVAVAAESGGDAPDVTLTGISATYSGGNVAAGTSVNDLTGISVTAHHSDGTSEPVSDYTLSGTIAEGSNIITVSYGGKTATFTVTGVAENTDGKIQLSTLDIADGILKADGSVYSTNNGHHVTLPYTDGMQISAGTNKSWNTNTYPPVLVLDGGTYSKAEISVSEDSVQVGNAIVYPCTATLSGYSADAVVHVSMLAGVRNYTLEEEMNLAGIYYYIPGGDV